MAIDGMSPRTAPLVARMWYWNRWPILCAGIHILVAWTVANWYGLGEHFRLSLYYYISLVNFGALALTVILGQAIPLIFLSATVHRKSPLAFVADTFRTRYRLSERLAIGLPILVLLPLHASVYTTAKIMLPTFHDFDWDTTFLLWDRWLHGGTDPWLILQPLLGHPLVTRLINAAYHSWFIPLYASIFLMTFVLKAPRLRAQFLICHFVAWGLMGNLMATIFASAGPCYYELLTGDATFAPLMEYLRAANTEYDIAALGVQDSLWKVYIEGLYVNGGGISAMPSMHIGSTVLMALVAWHFSRVLSIAFVVFAVVMLLGSVHLAWHYAIDGYVAIVLVLGLWYGVGWLLRYDNSLNSDLVDGEIGRQSRSNMQDQTRPDV